MRLMKQFLTDFTEEELKGCIDAAYDCKFDTEVIAPLVKVGRYLSFGVVPWCDDCIQGYGAVDPAASSRPPQQRKIR